MKESELVGEIKELFEKIAESWRFLDIDKKSQQLKEKEVLMSQADFWRNQDQAKLISRQASDLREEIETWQKIQAEVLELLSLAQEDEKDKSVNLREEVEKQLEKLNKKFAKLEFALLFRGVHDKDNAILAIHAGTGGVDAMDWAQMLLRMYLRFCEKKKFKVKIIDESRGAEAGIKSAVLEITGAYAYGNLKSENGVHRLVRISPFDAEKMRHTSFALVEVIPAVDEISELLIKDEDLRIDVYRSSGKGGQGVNTTDSAVRITHLPTGIVVTCQNERSQLQNKKQALKYLQSKLAALAEAEKDEEKKRLRGEYTEGSWGNQIRSYVLQPYQLVKDHRSDFETPEVEDVLDGELDGFIEAFLKLK